MEKSNICFWKHSSWNLNSYLQNFRPGARAAFITYLGASLISTRLKAEHCQPQLDAILKRISNWKAKWLSYAGWVQLINSTLTGLLFYWFSIFKISASVKDKLEQIMSRFLWTGSDIGHTRAKVSWARVCLPKQEGGLGFRKLDEIKWCLPYETFLENCLFWI